MVNETSPKLRVVGIVIGWLSLIASVVLLGVAVVFILPVSIFGQTMYPVYIGLGEFFLILLLFIFATQETYL